MYYFEKLEKVKIVVILENIKWEERLNNNVEIPKGEYNVFQVTQRYRWDYNWKKLINSQINPNYFIGLKSEYDDFIKTYDII